jgi:hypothetical protein
MFKSAIASLLAAITLGLICPVAAAEPEGKDAFGDPLPPGALARLGTTRFRLRWEQVSLDLAPDGQSYAQSAGPFLALSSTKTGQVLHDWTKSGPEDRKSDPYRDVRISSDGRLLVAHRRDSLLSFDLQSGKERKSPPLPIESGQTGQLVYAGDARCCAWCRVAGKDGLVDVFDLTGGAAGEDRT